MARRSRKLSIKQMKKMMKKRCGGDPVVSDVGPKNNPPAATPAATPPAATPPATPPAAATPAKEEPSTFFGISNPFSSAPTNGGRRRRKTAKKSKKSRKSRKSRRR